MDASFSIPCPKKISSKGQKKNDGISSLPDCILHHILSFLPTKYAVATSVLSTRWKWLWTATWNLEFSDTLVFSRSCEKFTIPVERVLLLHDAPFICKFSFSSGKVLDASRVKAWIRTAMKRKVQELSLRINLKGPLVFSRTLFTCESFTKIELHGAFPLPNDKPVPIASSSVCFPSLKFLRLENIEVSCDQAMQQLFFSIPVAEEVVFIYCLWANIKVVNISTPALKRLIIDDYSFDEETGNDHYYDCEVKVNAETLTSLDLRSSLSYDLSFCNLTSLYRASIEIDFNIDFNYGSDDRARKLLEGICGVTDLTVSDTSIESFGSVCFENLLTFSNLKVMRITDDPPLSGDDFTKLFSCLPTIEFLSIGLTPNTYQYYSTRYNQELGTVPHFFLLQLKSIEVTGFSATKNEISMVGYFLMNARSLEIMKIVSSSTDPKTQINVTKQLVMLPRVSPRGVIQFS